MQRSLRLLFYFCELVCRNYIYFTLFWAPSSALGGFAKRSAGFEAAALFPPFFFVACHVKWLSPCLAHFSLHWLCVLSGCTALIGWVASRWRDDSGRLSPLKSPAARLRRLALFPYTGRCTSALIRIQLRFQQLTSVGSPWQQSLFTFSPLKAEHYFFSTVSGHQPAQQKPSIWTICLLGYCVGNVKSSKTLLLRLTYRRGIWLNGPHERRADIFFAQNDI